METSAIKRACAALGGQSALARELGLRPQTVQKMCSTGRVKAEHVPKISALSGVPKHELRPDLYLAETSQPTGGYFVDDEEGV